MRSVPELQYYRLSLMPSLLEKVQPNVRAGYKEFALFEIGKTHSTDHGDDDDGLPREFEFTGLVVAADDRLKKAGAAYYQARAYLEALVGQNELTFKAVSEEIQAYAVTKPYDLKRAALVSLSDGTFLGIIGEFRSSVIGDLKLPKFSAGFEVDTTALASVMATGQSYEPLLRFPGVKQDMTLTVPMSLPHDQLQSLVASGRCQSPHPHWIVALSWSL